MKTIYFFAISLLCILGYSDKLIAQVDFFPSGAKWDYGFSAPGLLRVKGFTHFNVIGDTVIDARPSKILGRMTYLFDYDLPTTPTDTLYYPHFYMAQTHDSILYYQDGYFQFLWKMVVQSGDSYDVVDDIFTYTMDVVNVETLNFDTLEVHKISIEGGTMYGQSGEDIIYDQFGPNSGFIYYQCWGFYDCYSPSLCRYSNDAINEVKFPGVNCDILSTATSELKNISFHTYPNPFNKSFFVSLPEKIVAQTQLEIYTTSGQFLSSQILLDGNASEVVFGDLPCGTYICKIRSQQHVGMELVVKM